MFSTEGALEYQSKGTDPQGCPSSHFTVKASIYERKFFKSHIRPTLMISVDLSLAYTAFSCPQFLTKVCLECLISLCVWVSVWLECYRKLWLDPVGKLKKKKTKHYISCLVRDEKPEQMCLSECLFSMEKWIQSMLSGSLLDFQVVDLESGAD